MRWMWLAFWLLTASASAQRQDPLADPGRPMPPYECVGCAYAPVYQDPYGAEIAHLMQRRRSYFGPIALMAAGGTGAVLFTAVSIDSDASYDRLSAGALTAVSVAMVGFGAVWYVHRKKQRAAIDQRIAELETARAAGIPYAQVAALPREVAPPLPRIPRRPSLGGPISFVAVGGGLLAAGAGIAGLAVTIEYGEDLIVPAVLAGAAGVGMVTAGAVWWKRRKGEQRAFDRTLDLSGLPFVVRW